MAVSVDLFQVVVGATTYRWTSGDTAITYASNSYPPLPSARTEIQQSEELGQDGIKITLPVSHALAQLYLTATPDVDSDITLYRQDASGTYVVWKGGVGGVSATDSEATLTGESLFKQFQRNGLRARYQKNCRHSLYSGGCTLNKATFAVAGTCTAFSGNTVTVTEAASQPDGYYVGGMIKSASGALRTIVGHVGSTLTLFWPIPGFATGAVTIYPGCDRTLATCQARFTNHVNYGGFPWIPSQNPYGPSGAL
ncbi:MAG: phage BR0599 family protein [Porticoccaceae bacterium]